jgi:hypothetical protein
VTPLRLVVDGASDSLALPVRCDDDGTFHGFGAQYNATNQQGERFPLIVGEQGIGREPDVVETGAVKINGDEHTTYFPMPWWVDARGFGALVRTDRRVDVDLCASDETTAWIESISADPFELTVVHGPTPKHVITQLGALVGRPSTRPTTTAPIRSPTTTVIRSTGTHGRARCSTNSDPMEIG